MSNMADIGSDLHTVTIRYTARQDSPLNADPMDHNSLAPTTGGLLAYDSEGEGEGQSNHHDFDSPYDADDEWESSWDAEDDEDTLSTTNNNLPFNAPANTIAATPLPTLPRSSLPLSDETLLPHSTSESSLFSALRAWFDMPSPSDADFNISDDTDFDVPSILEGMYTSSPSLSSSWLLEDGEQGADEQQTDDQADDEEDPISDDDSNDDEAMANFWLNIFMTTPAGIAFMVNEVDQELDDLSAEEFDTLMGLITDGEVDDESSSRERWEDEDEDGGMAEL
ncbi:uncharacterized protein B0T15DRAFT_540672 [Chaetomium strumarium]|uniref:Uncharacterized protein n=1 Tax=Chaetomium strumarium TaxID=1170767 RepID=A0AAJ0GPM9_9PEZI|nr:hypothetical protein B0T15DRAFT_540672 [Chaetomium strumarium]